MKPPLIFIVTAWLAVPLPSQAQVSVPYAQQVEWFFNSLRAGRSDDAVDTIYANNDRSRNGWVAQLVGFMDDISDWSKERAKARYLNSSQR